MNRADLEAKISERTNIAPRVVSQVLETAFLEIIEALKQGERVSHNGFGSFSLRDRPSREMYIPTLGAVSSIAAKRQVVFTPGRQLTRAIAIIDENV